MSIADVGRAKSQAVSIEVMEVANDEIARLQKRVAELEKEQKSSLIELWQIALEQNKREQERISTSVELFTAITRFYREQMEKYERRELGR